MLSKDFEDGLTVALEQARQGNRAPLLALAANAKTPVAQKIIADAMKETATTDDAASSRHTELVDGVLKHFWG